MAGSDQSKNLSGMFNQINAPISEMGAAGNQYVDTFRRSMAPRANMNDSASLLKYADWARRNGYDEEAKQYMVLGAGQQKVEQEKAYTTSVATGTEKLRGIRGNIAGVNQEIARQEAAGVVNPDLLDARDTLNNQLTTTVSSLNAMGTASNYGI